jgi:hypothetical protein
MEGGFDSKPGATSLVHEAFEKPRAPATPGKQTLTGMLGPVQRKAGAPTAEAAGALNATPGAGARMEPGLQHDMERSFGADFSSVRIHEGGAAGALGARAFTRGESIHVAPGELNPSSPDSRSLIGHELAHVVQQRAGRVATPQGFGGLGINDDAGLEAEADRAGDRAARGEPAGMAHAGGTAATGHAPVQAKLRWAGELQWINAKTNPAIASKFSTLAAVENEADTRTGGVDIEVLARKPQQGTAAFSFQKQQVEVQPMPSGSEKAIQSLSGGDVNDRVIALSHELQHACDAFQSDDKPLQSALRKVAPWEELIHGEWRAHATQAKAAIEIAGKQGPGAVPSRHKDLIDRWKVNTFDKSQANQPQSMFSITRSYILQYSKQPASDDQVDAFIKANAKWKAEAFALCPPVDKGTP